MFNPKEKSYVFVPGTESHFNSFLPISDELVKKGYHSYILEVDEFITNNRKFGNNDTIKIGKDDLLLSVLNWPNDIIIITGNDSDWEISKILRIARKKKIKVALMQDGWLDAKNIKRPIYSQSGIIYFIKKRLHVFLTQSWMPTKPYIHNLIGQNSDFFLVFSEIAKQNFIKANLKEKDIFVTGSPRHNLLKNELKSIPKPKETAIVIFSTFIKNDHDKLITNAGISMVIQKFPNQKIIIKLHPSEDFEKYRHYIKDNVFVEKCNLTDIFHKYLIVMSFCFASTVVFDMLMLDVPIIQLAPEDAYRVMTNYYKDLGIAQDYSELNILVEDYDLYKTKQLSSKYLSDINSSFNSVEETVKVLIKNNNK